jgi:hypothetical protein
VHKVETGSLTWIENDVRRLKSRIWQTPLAASGAAAGLSVFFAGLVAIVNHSGETSVPTFDWCLLVGGIVAFVALGIGAVVSLVNRRGDVDMCADRIKEMRY